MSDAHLYLHHYPRQEALADVMIESLATEGKGQPFHQSTVLIQNRGMATWLRQKIAIQHGLCMLVDFPLPGAFLEQCLPHLLGKHTEPMVTQSQLAWMIYSILPKLIKRPAFHPVRRYLEDDSVENSQRKRLELSDSLAAIFDRYQTYRPEWLRAWEAGDHITEESTEIWQREIWLALREKHGTLNHWGNVISELQKTGVHSLQPNITKLPTSLHVFGVSNLPPCYVDLLYVLSHFLPVHVYWMNPVESYWEDAPNRQTWLLEHALTDQDQIKLANPLLASFGRMGREFIGTLHGGSHSNYDWQEKDFEPDEPTPDERDSALEHIQYDIHQNLHAPNLTPDESLTVHSCHSPLREVETVRQHILQLLAQQPSLDTSDLLVMCPNIEEYTPAIEAAFGAIPQDDPHFLPFRISDRSIPAREPSIAAFLDIFQLPKSRFTSKDALSLLGIHEIASSFQIQPQNLSTIRQWIEKTGIRWGVDADHVRELSEASSPADWSWQSGLEKLLLGATMSGNSLSDPSAQLLWNGILPYSDMEGNSLSLLESLSTFLEWVKEARKDLKQQRTLTQWVEWSQQLIETRFSATQDSEASMRPALLALDELAVTASELQLKDTIHASVFADQLSAILSKTSPPGGFLSGSITFCEMSPMRAIPTQHLCILGLNAGSYPRPNTPNPFDLTKIERKAGDRSPRDDDNYLFLEAILSARESLYLSFTGTSIRDNTNLPPSSTLQTLLDAYPALQQSIIQEKIHPFSVEYFQSPTEDISGRLQQSRDISMLESALALSSKTSAAPAPRFPAQSITPPDTVTIDQFLACFINSSKFFLRNSLEASNRWLDTLVQTEETAELDALESFHLKRQLVEQGSLSAQQILAKQASSQLPPAELGLNTLQKHTEDLGTLLSSLPPTSPFLIDTELRQLRTVGSISVQTDSPDTVQIVNPSSIKAKDYLNAWISLLVLRQHTGKPAYAEIYSSKEQEPHKLDDPGTSSTEILATLIELYRQAHNSPLTHFPKTSFTYVKELQKSNALEQPLSEKVLAQKTIKEAWKDKYIAKTKSTIPGESSNLDNTLLHNTQEPISTEFIRVSKSIWTPILNHLTAE